ncbi:hypothetical protein D3C72_2245420 [compost metagenome]
MIAQTIVIKPKQLFLKDFSHIRTLAAMADRCDITIDHDRHTRSTAIEMPETRNIGVLQLDQRFGSSLLIGV